ncbi:MAG: hypothetical protein Q8K94_08615, partial [Moraxellaceae bacterium]|nr:hypothetical protein [Moraxellaceae bacterium]
MHLIIPIAGSSSRFPDMKPKWMLTHPRGKMMVIEAIRNLPLIQFKSINFIGLKTHEDEYNFSNSLNIQFKEIGIDHLANIILLDEKTSNQPETVYKGLKKSGITGQIYIKDSDNQFTTEFVSGNFISYLDLHELDQINARNKSYVELN